MDPPFFGKGRAHPICVRRTGRRIRTRMVEGPVSGTKGTHLTHTIHNTAWLAENQSTLLSAKASVIPTASASRRHPSPPA